jgi:hypothetical protein
MVVMMTTKKPSTRQNNPTMGYFPTLLLLLLFNMGLFEYNGTTTILLQRFKGIIGEASSNNRHPACTYKSMKERLQQLCSLPPFQMQPSHDLQDITSNTNCRSSDQMSDSLKESQTLSVAYWMVMAMR